MLDRCNIGTPNTTEKFSVIFEGSYIFIITIKPLPLITMHLPNKQMPNSQADVLVVATFLQMVRCNICDTKCYIYPKLIK